MDDDGNSVRMAPGFDLVSLEPLLYHSKYLFFGLVELLFFPTIHVLPRASRCMMITIQREHNAGRPSPPFRSGKLSLFWRMPRMHRLTRKRDPWPFNIRQRHLLLYNRHLYTEKGGRRGGGSIWLNPRTRVIEGDPATAGWSGCNHSLSTLTIGGEILLTKRWNSFQKRNNSFLRRDVYSTRTIFRIKEAQGLW